MGGKVDVSTLIASKPGYEATTYLECLVPAASHCTAVVGGLDPVNRLDRSRMLREETGTGTCIHAHVQVHAGRGIQ